MLVLVATDEDEDEDVVETGTVLTQEPSPGERT